jgi:hypothetical protein
MTLYCNNVKFLFSDFDLLQTMISHVLCFANGSNGFSLKNNAIYIEDSIDAYEDDVIINYMKSNDFCKRLDGSNVRGSREKSPALMQQLIEMCCPKGGSVLDLTVGTCELHNTFPLETLNSSLHLLKGLDIFLYFCDLLWYKNCQNLSTFCAGASMEAAIGSGRYACGFEGDATLHSIVTEQLIKLNSKNDAGYPGSNSKCN